MACRVNSSVKREEHMHVAAAQIAATFAIHVDRHATMVGEVAEIWCKCPSCSKVKSDCYRTAPLPPHCTSSVTTLRSCPALCESGLLHLSPILPWRARQNTICGKAELRECNKQETKQCLYENSQYINGTGRRNKKTIASRNVIARFYRINSNFGCYLRHV